MRSWMSGIAVAIICTALSPRLPQPPVCILLCLLSGVFWLRTGVGCKVISGLLLGCVIASLHGNGLLQRRLSSHCVGQALSLSGEVVSLPRQSLMADGTPRQRFEFRVTQLLPESCAGPQRVLLSYYGDKTLVPGEHWQFLSRLKRPWGLANPGSYNLQAWFAQTGIDAVGSVSRAQALRIAAPAQFSSAHHRLRQRISARIAALPYDREVRAILQALTVADKSGIDAALWGLFQQFGINHLLVISGLHVGLVAGGGYLLGGLLLRLTASSVPWLRTLPGLCAGLLASGYVTLAGFSLSTQRALFMLGAFIIADMVGRRCSPAGKMLLAAVIILVLNPLAALGSGFWLSFIAVAGLVWLAQWRRDGGRLLNLASTHLYMMLLMLPLGAWWFGGASLVAAPANLLLIPLVGMLIVPAALLATCCFLLGSSFEHFLWWIAAWPIQRLIPLADALDDVAGDGLYWQLQGSQAEILLALLAVTLWVVRANIALRIFAIVFGLPLLLPNALPESLPPGHTRVTVLDVGQGTAVLVEAGNRALLYDTGGGDPAGSNMATAVILPFLRSSGITQLDTFVVSHPDRDHAAGTAAILRAVDVQRRRYGGVLPGMTGGVPCVAGEAWTWPGGPSFQFLSPALEQGLASNNASCVLLIDTGSQRLLLPGDVEAGRERELARYWGADLASSWLLVAHHGSKTSSTRTFLKWVDPEIAVISHGYANRFGHPHVLVQQRLHAATAEIHATASSGALVFDFTAGQPPAVRAYREKLDPYWM